MTVTCKCGCGSAAKNMYIRNHDKRRPIHERINAKLDKTGDCWIWRGSLVDGYGRVKHDGAVKSVHRLIWEEANGPVPPGMVIDHTCRNRACAKLAHLHVVTRKQNSENLGVRRTSASGVRGVRWNAECKKWSASVFSQGTRYYLGLFQNIEAAERAVIAKRNEVFTNNISDWGHR